MSTSRPSRCCGDGLSRHVFVPAASRHDRTVLGQKCPKRLRLPAGKNTREDMGRIVPIADIARRFVTN